MPPSHNILCAFTLDTRPCVWYPTGKVRTKTKPQPSVSRRIWIPLTGNDRPDLSRMSEPARERLRQWYTDQTFLESIGAVPQPEVREPELPLTEREAAALWRIIGNIQAYLASRALKLPPQAAEALRFSDAEAAILAQPTVALINRYAPAWLSDHKDEAVLLLLLFTIEQQKFARAFAIKRQIEAQTESSEPQHQAEAQNMEGRQ